MKVELYNEVGIGFDEDKQMVNATQMLAAHKGKNLTRILNSVEMTDYKDALVADMQNGLTADTEWVRVVQGGKDKALQGTWIHPKLALRVAQKLSPKFAVWVDGKIEELLHNSYVGINDCVTRLIGTFADQIAVLQKSTNEMIEKNKLMAADQKRQADNSRALTYEVSLQQELSYLMNLAECKHSVEYAVEMGRLDIVLKRRKPYITVFELKNYNHELSGYDIDAHLFSKPIVELYKNTTRHRAYLNKLIDQGYDNIKFHFVVHREPSKYAYIALEKALEHVKNSGYNIDIKISRLSEVVAHYWRIVEKKHGSRCNDHLNSMPKLKGIIESIPKL